MASHALANLLGHIYVTDGATRRSTSVVVMSPNVHGDADQWPLFRNPVYEECLLDRLRRRVPGWSNSSELYVSVLRPSSWFGDFMLLDYNDRLWNMDVEANLNCGNGDQDDMTDMLGGTAAVYFHPDGTQTWLIGEDAVIDLRRCHQPEPPSVIRENAAKRIECGDPQIGPINAKLMRITTFTPELLAYARANPDVVRIMMNCPFGPPLMLAVRNMVDRAPAMGTYTCAPI